MNNVFLWSSKRALLASALTTLLLTVPANQAKALGGVNEIHQSAIVNGIIVDSAGEPIIGATIKVKGGQAGSISDFNGNFAIDANRGQELEVSYIGYKTQVVKVNG